MSQDWNVEEPLNDDPDHCPPLTGSPLGNAAVAGLLSVSVYSLIGVMLSILLLMLGGTGAWFLFMSLGANSVDPVQSTLVIVGVVLCLAVTQLLPMISAAAGVYTALAMHRGSRRVNIYIGAVISLIGPMYLAGSSVLTLVVAGFLGMLIMMGATLMVAVSVASVVATFVAVAQATASLDQPLPER